MSISDDQLASLEHSLGMIESEYTPTCRSVPYGSGCPGATDDSLDFWRRAADAVPAMIAEIRQRRAAALSDDQLAIVDQALAMWSKGRDGYAEVADRIRNLLGSAK
jgi:hypothetical protein